MKANTGKAGTVEAFQATESRESEDEMMDPEMEAILAKAVAVAVLVHPIARKSRVYRPF